MKVIIGLLYRFDLHSFSKYIHLHRIMVLLKITLELNIRLLPQECFLASLLSLRLKIKEGAPNYFANKRRINEESLSRGAKAKKKVG